MTTKQLFIQYQHHILAFANTDNGRSYLNISTSEKIIRLTPDSYHIKIGEDLYQATFFSGSPFSAKLQLALECCVFAEDYLPKKKNEFVLPHFIGLFTKPDLPQIYLTTGTFNPNASPETTSTDGVAREDNSGANNNDSTWSTVRGLASSNQASHTGTDDYIAETFQYGGGSFPAYGISRGIFLFDTSSLGGGSTISSGVFSLAKTNTGFSNPDSVSVGVLGCTPASNTTIGVADFSCYSALNSPTEYVTRVPFSTFVAGSYQDMTLNASGILAVSKTGVTKFMTRTSQDIDNSTPPNGSFNTLKGNHADNATNKPKLVIVYVGGAYYLTGLLET